MKLINPATGRTNEVTDRAARVHKRFGWVEATETPAVDELTVDQVLDEVGDDPAKAAAALAAEQGREHPRSTLVDALTRTTHPESATDGARED